MAETIHYNNVAFEVEERFLLAENARRKRSHRAGRPVAGATGKKKR